MDQLRALETSTAIQARIEGLQLKQVDVVNRLRSKGISEELIMAAAKAHEEKDSAIAQEKYSAAEEGIIAEFMEKSGLPEDFAVSSLNGASGGRYA